MENYDECEKNKNFVPKILGYSKNCCNFASEINQQYSIT